MRIFISTKEKFKTVDILGKTPKEMLTTSLKGKFSYIDSIKDIREISDDYIVLLYQDTPLVDYEFLKELCKENKGYKIGDGFIKPNGYTGQLQPVEDIRAFQIKNLSDIAPIYKEMKRRINKKYKDRNILFYDIDSCYIDQDVEIADGCIIHPMVTLKGKTKIGENCVIFSHSELINTQVSRNVDIRSSFCTDAKIGAFTTVGPFACLRMKANIGAYCRIGDFVEIKNATIDDNSNMAHLAYVGDSTVGRNTNIGCGAVFANFDGKSKHSCKVGDNVFIGANSILVAPVTLHDGAFIAAGSTVTDDVPSGNLCIARSRQVLKDSWEPVKE